MGNVNDFRPTDLPGCLCWLTDKDFYVDDPPVTLATTQGERVRLWKDQSGNGNNARIMSEAPAVPVEVNGIVNLGPLLKKADAVSFLGEDNGPIIRAAIKTYATNTSNRVTFYIPAGMYRVDTPVEVDVPYVTFRGDGNGITTLLCSRWNPCFVVAAPGADTVPDSANPSVNSVLDGTVSGYGVATLGKYTLAAYCNVMTMGRRHPTIEGETWEYYGSLQRFTIQIAYSGELSAGQGLMSIGENINLYKDGQGRMNLAFGTHDGSVYPESPRSNIVWTQPAAPLHRLRIYVDMVSNQFGVYDLGSSMSPSLEGQSFSGRYLAPNYKGDPFLFGSYGSTVPRSSSVSNITIYGYKFSQSAVTSEPANDQARYLSPDADTVYYLPLGPRYGRFLPVRGGNAVADGQFAYMIYIDSSTSLQGLVSFELRDLQIRFAAPAVLYGQSLDMFISNCELIDGSTPVEFMRVGAAYPLVVEDTALGGLDACISLATTYAYLNNVVMRVFNGPSAVRSFASSFDWRKGNVWFPSENTHRLFAMYGGHYGGRYVFDNIAIDDESHANHPRNAVFYVEKNGNDPGFLRIDGFSCAVLASPTAAVVDVVGDNNPGNSKLLFIEAKNLSVFGTCYVLRSAGYGMYGSVESTMCPDGTVSTDGHSTIKVYKVNS